MLVEVESGEVEPLDGLKRGDMPLQWMPDGRALLVGRSVGDVGLEKDLFRYELSSKKLTKISRIGPADTVGVSDVRCCLVTPDAKSYVFNLNQAFDELYVIEGLH